jgi:RNA-directed DNA polymerase
LKTNIVESAKDMGDWKLNELKCINKYTWVLWDQSSKDIKGLKDNYRTIMKEKDNKRGIPQGGIISPLLLNWTLDGLSYAARKGSVTDKTILLNTVLPATTKNSQQPGKTNLYSSAHLIRFADDFVFTTLNPQGAKNARKAIEEFLNIRGLSMSKEKTRVIKMSMGSKFDFLGWTFHLISPNKVNWLTDVANSVSTNLKDRTKLYVYPSAKSTSSFRYNIKQATSMKFVALGPRDMIKKLNAIIWGWSNYFIPSPNQYSLRSNLDHYTFKRVMKWIFKKYGKKSYSFMVENLLWNK